MSIVAIGMDLLLAALLIGALSMGWRLNGKLKALRASQHDFAKAVMELDAAALRAESGLKALQAAAEEAHDSLLARIDTARALAAKLEKAEASADGAARRAEAAAAEVKAMPVPSREAFAREPSPREPSGREQGAPQIRSLNPIRDILGPAPAPKADPVPSPRRRNLADEALFADEGETAVRSGLQGLMRMSLARR